MAGARMESGPWNYLRAWREHRGLTQAELAAMVGTEGSVISLLESGSRGLSDKWLRRLAAPLRTTPGCLLDFHPETVDEAMLEQWGRIREAQPPLLRPKSGRSPDKVVRLRVPSRKQDEDPASKRDQEG